MTAARCDLSDLPVDQCACRIHGPAEERRQPQNFTVLARIEAQYPGHCRACGDDYAVSDRITLVVTLGWIHEECAA